MREIKYRFYLKGVAIDKMHDMYIVSTGRMFEADRIDFENRRVAVAGAFNATYWLDFDGVELMQFTGLHDKNGTEIYEGDILSSKWRCRVIFEQGCFMVYFHTNPHVNLPRTLDVFLAGRERAGDGAEVIGNIHENPELLNE